MTMDKKLENEILAAVRAAIGKVMTEQKEVWLNQEELCKQFQFLTPAWLKRHGRLLPQTCATVILPDGKTTTRPAYAMHEIQAMIKDWRIRALMSDKCVKVSSRR